MYEPTLKEFLKLARHGNVIPVYKEINADLDTPVSAYLKMKKSGYAFLLESVEGQEKIARFSFLGSDPSLVISSKGRNVKIIRPHNNRIERFVATGSPLDEIKKIMRPFKSVHVKGLPRFYGGLVGFMGYDMVRFFEKLPDKNPNDLGIEDSVFMLTDTMLIFDHVNHTIKMLCNVFIPHNKVVSRKGLEIYYRKALNKIESMHNDFQNTAVNLKETRIKEKASKVSSNFKKSEFEALVRRAKAYIKKGDIIQVVPSQRFKIKTKRNPFDIYRSLRSLNPSPYMYFLKLNYFYLAGASPEMLVRCENGLIQTRPIAGTRPRGKNEEEDKKLADELIKDKKERAEHLMLVDLGRNDLGRVGRAGKVEVSEFMSIEKYSHVMHLVSEVRARLDNSRFDVYDVLKAAFPAGTVSGAPKIRAMEIIDELENVRRGPYAGCVGYFSFSHNMDTCITIRTVLIKNNTAYIQAGGGIVADSIPAKEYRETVNKAKALIEAINN
ncbi:MAG: anthranilate synthase component I [Candidatus Omnitrophica bacterium]|nr:anthranilate synthase component I [Candidatus Omnitrophota bacterium]